MITPSTRLTLPLPAVENTLQPRAHRQEVGFVEEVAPMIRPWRIISERLSQAPGVLNRFDRRFSPCIICRQSKLFAANVVGGCER